VLGGSKKRPKNRSSSYLDIMERWLICINGEKMSLSLVFLRVLKKFLSEERFPRILLLRPN